MSNWLAVERQPVNMPSGFLTFFLWEKRNTTWILFFCKLVCYSMFCSFLASQKESYLANVGRPGKFQDSWLKQRCRHNCLKDDILVGLNPNLFLSNSPRWLVTSGVIKYCHPFWDQPIDAKMHGHFGGFPYPERLQSKPPRKWGRNEKKQHFFCVFFDPATRIPMMNPIWRFSPPPKFITWNRDP